MLDAWSNHWLGSEHPTYLSCAIKLTCVQLAAEASFLSLVSVIVVFVLVGVCLTLFLAPIYSDRMSHRGTYFVIGGCSRTVTGSYCNPLLTSIWFA